MSGFDDDFLAGPASALAPAPSAKGAASPSPVASSVDDFDAFVSAPSAVEQSSGFLSPEAAEPARATSRASRAKIVSLIRSLERAGKSVLIHDGFGFLSPEVEAVNAAQAGVAGAQRLRAVVARVTPKQWGIALGGLALAVGLTFGVRWWMQRPPASPVVAAAKKEALVTSAASIAAVATTPVVTATVTQKSAAPVVAPTMPAAPAIAPAAVARPAAAAPKKDPWTVAHAADIQKSMQHTEKTSDAWAKDQSARLDAFFKKKH